MKHSLQPLECTDKKVIGYKKLYMNVLGNTNIINSDHGLFPRITFYQPSNLKIFIVSHYNFSCILVVVLTNTKLFYA